MTCRLTYALTADEIYTTDLDFLGDDIFSAYDTALEYLQEQHEYPDMIQIKALSILLIEESRDEN